jgi:hypothetical protein
MGGGSGSGRSASMLYHLVGISSTGSENCLFVELAVVFVVSFLEVIGLLLAESSF